MVENKLQLALSRSLANGRLKSKDYKKIKFCDGDVIEVYYDTGTDHGRFEFSLEEFNAIINNINPLQNSDDYDTISMNDISVSTAVPCVIEDENLVYKTPRWLNHSQNNKPKDNSAIKPNYYKSGKIDLIEFMKEHNTKAEFKGFMVGNAMKYLTRLGRKDNELQDLDKAIYYLEKYKKFLTGLDNRDKLKKLSEHI